MRTYRIEIRLIQLATLLAAVILISGFFNASIWGAKEKAPDPGPSSGATTPVNQGNPVQVPPVDLTKKIVALGDSFTFGYPGTVDQSWPKRLADVLNIEVVNKGKSAQTAKDLLDRFDQDVVGENPGTVIIFVGNGEALNNVPLETFQTNLKLLVEKARTNHITPVLTLPLPYKGVQESVKAMRDWETDYAKTEKILLLDFATVLMDDNRNYLPGLSNDDGKYPTAKGYQTMGDYAAEMLK